MTAADVITSFLPLGLIALIAWKVSQRRNWARWVLAVVVGLGVLSAVFSVVVAPQLWQSMSALFQAIALLQTLFQLAALVLLFTGEAKLWFGRQGAAV